MRQRLVLIALAVLLCGATIDSKKPAYWWIFPEFESATLGASLNQGSNPDTVSELDPNLKIQNGFDSFDKNSETLADETEQDAGNQDYLKVDSLEEDIEILEKKDKEQVDGPLNEELNSEDAEQETFKDPNTEEANTEDDVNNEEVEEQEDDSNTDEVDDQSTSEAVSDDAEQEDRKVNTEEVEELGVLPEAAAPSDDEEAEEVKVNTEEVEEADDLPETAVASVDEEADEEKDQSIKDTEPEDLNQDNVKVNTEEVAELEDLPEAGAASTDEEADEAEEQSISETVFEDAEQDDVKVNTEEVEELEDLPEAAAASKDQEADEADNLPINETVSVDSEQEDVKVNTEEVEELDGLPEASAVSVGDESDSQDNVNEEDENTEPLAEEQTEEDNVDTAEENTDNPGEESSTVSESLETENLEETNAEDSSPAKDEVKDSDDQEDSELDKADKSVEDEDKPLPEDADEDSEESEKPVSYLTGPAQRGFRNFDVQETDDDSESAQFGTLDIADDYGGISNVVDLEKVNETPVGNEDDYDFEEDKAVVDAVEKLTDEDEVDKQTDETDSWTDEDEAAKNDETDETDKQTDEIENETEEDETDKEADKPTDETDSWTDEDETANADETDETDGDDCLQDTVCETADSNSNFNVTLSKESIVIEEASSVTLKCNISAGDNFTPNNAEVQWLFQGVSCDDTDVSCMEVLQSESYSTCCGSRSSSCKKLSSLSTVSSHLYLTNVQRNQTGVYRCVVRAARCQQDGKPIILEANAAIAVKVYGRANYTAHISIVTITCLLLVIVLVALTLFARKMMRKQRENYRSIIANTTIQYQPIKGLELPQTGVYRETTYKQPSVSSFSSRSSFVSAEEAA